MVLAVCQWIVLRVWLIIWSKIQPIRGCVSMPRGPQGQRRPADGVGCAVRVAQIATGEIEEAPVKKTGRVRSGHAGAKARAKKLSAEKRSDIAKKASAARWG